MKAYYEEKFVQRVEGVSPTISVRILEKIVKIDSLTEAKLYLFEIVANFIIEKTIVKKIQFAKSKTNNLLLTYFNNYNSKTLKKN